MPESKEQQQFFMRRALELGERGRTTAPPNPWVGAVIVKNGNIIGEGFHTASGEPHAEINALKMAQKGALGATLYVTLEPCCHLEKKTPPCVQAIVEAGIKHVVVALKDPDSHVQGEGVTSLKKRGVEVTLGVLEEEATKSLRPYLYQRKKRVPFCVLKAAMSLDGCIAAKDGSSRWITGEKGRHDAHQLRAESDAILVGTQTALTDNPELTIRHVESPRGKQPLRIVVDRQGKVRGDLKLLDTRLAKTLIFTTERASITALKEWEKKGVEIEVAPEIEGKISLRFLMEKLYQRNLIQLLVEGGNQLQTSFVAEGFANQLTLYLGNCLLGKEGKHLFNLCGPSTMKEASRLFLEKVHSLDQDVRLDYFFDCLN